MRVETRYFWRQRWAGKVMITPFPSANCPAGCTEADRVEGPGRTFLVPDQVCEWDEVYQRTGTCATTKANRPTTLFRPSCHPDDPGRTQLYAECERYDISRESDVWIVVDNHPNGRREVYRGPGPVSIEPTEQVPNATSV